MTGIFMYGAEPAGGLFAARSQEGGSYVSVLAWGQRVGELRAHRIVLVDA